MYPLICLFEASPVSYLILCNAKRKEQPEIAPRPSATQASCINYLDLPRYSPVLVSIWIFSPCSIKIGTCTTAPVSTVAAFVTFVAVLPLTPGSVSITSRWTTKLRCFYCQNALPWKNFTVASSFGLMNLIASSTCSLPRGIWS